MEGAYCHLVCSQMMHQDHHTKSLLWPNHHWWTHHHHICTPDRIYYLTIVVFQLIGIITGECNSLYLEAKVKFLLTISPLQVEAVTVSFCSLFLFKSEYDTLPSSVWHSNILQSYYYIYCNVLLQGVGRLSFRLHKKSTFGLFASNVKVKLFPTTDGLQTGQVISSTEQAANSAPLHNCFSWYC